MNAGKLISVASVLALISLTSQIKTRAQNLSPWPYSESCNSSAGACFAITNSNAAGVGLGGITAANGMAYSGVVGSATGTANGVGGGSNGGNGVLGTSTTGNGVYGIGNTSGVGVRGISTNSSGVYGISSTGNAVLGQNNDTTNSAAAISAVPGSSAGLAFYGGGNLYLAGNTAWKTGGGSFTAISDRRVKKDVGDFTQGLASLLKVRPVHFKYNGLGDTSDDGKEFVGVIAQDLEKIVPTMVSSRMAKLHPTDTEKTAIKQVDPSNFTYLLINAIQEQQNIIQRQEARLTALEKGKAPLASSLSSFGGISTAATFGLLPLGLVFAVRKSRKQKNSTTLS